jgi:uncharacterized protein with FMN-binding domain
MKTLRVVAAAVLLSVMATTAVAEDVVELLSGAIVRGEVTARTATDVTLKTTIAGQAVVRKFPLDRMHALTVGGKREVLHEKTGAAPAATPANPTTSAAPAQPVDPANRKSREQVIAEINQAGKTPPPWFASTPLVYPPTLDLSWPVPPPTKGWNPQLNVGQFFWDIINPNPGRWPQGIKLLHHMLGVNQGNSATVERVQLQIAHIYFSHFNDYARAAFWYRTAGAENTDEFGESAVALAECYFHLGNKDMAAEILSRISDRNSTLKAWTTLGEFDKALAIAKNLLSDGPVPLTLMYQGDAYRLAGRYDEALASYQRVLDLGPPGNNNGLKKQQGRAQASIDAIRLFEKSDVARVPDGTYQAQSLGYEGQIVVEVTVAAKRIASVRIVRHSEKQFYSALVDTPQRIIAKQSVKGVDTTSNATLTSEAIINATAKALAGAAK